MLRCGAIVLLIIPATLVAQRPQCPRSPGDTGAVAVTAVEQPPVADSANRWPIYPELLKQAGVGGSVRVIFALDTAGIPQPATIVIQRAPHVGFVMAVKHTVATWRFAPARLCGRPIRVRLSHEFEYRPITRRDDTLRLHWLFEDSTLARTNAAITDTLPDGTPHTILGDRSDSEAPPVFSDFDVLDAAARDSAEQAALAEVKRSPKETPFRITFRSKRLLSPNQVLFDVDVEQGTGGTRYRCGAERRGGVWRARCFLVSSWVS